MMEKRLSGSFLFVAETDNNIVGFANFSPSNQGEVELSAIYLYSNYQGKGIGTALLKEGVRSIDGIRVIYIDVEKENTIGNTFYEAKGFKTVEEFDDNFDGHILKTIRMVLKV
ncbi:acetyltransferase (GNAT) family protein [Saliterribacillus persicus]|uniref:Acetyltransferase (GNAT) family protein n=1 Tax=Saliterribacillus persicus TaxID=930114 RepID=A0A368XAC0_9BACI|nr:acetyltransferase (GNAT) family protein [Saliterribacillus persicus]